MSKKIPPKPQKKRPIVPFQRLSGKGDYNVKDEVKKSLKELIPMGVGTLTNMLMPGMGDPASKVTKAAMKAFAALTGFGDYTVDMNSVIANPNPTTPPKPMFGHGSVRTRDEEYIGELRTGPNGNFLNMLFEQVNPCNKVLFPKFSNKARLFQQYFIHGFVLRLESLCSEAFTTTNGNMSVPLCMAAAHYNVAEEKFKTDRQLLNTFFATSSRVNKDFVMPLECAPSEGVLNHLFCWTATQQGMVQDLKFMNFAILDIAFIGGSHNGEFPAYKVYVEFDIELLKPTIINIPPSVYDYTFETGLAIGKPFGTDLVLNSCQNGSPYDTLFTIGTNTIVFSPFYTGRVLIEVCYAYTETGVTSLLAIAASNGAALLNYFGPDDDQAYITNLGDDTAILFLEEAFTITNGGTLTFTAPNLTNWSWGELFITLLD
jgi:hypothetical protein